MPTLHTLITQALQENAISLDEKSIQQCATYLDLLHTWNRVFNLTTIVAPRDMVYLHLIDSLLVKPFLRGNRSLDVGSGAGLPGIPLAIADPQQQWVLLDKNSKKTRFLRQVIAELDLINVDIAHHRCEDFHPTFCFDNILSRAFGTLALFTETTKHLLCAKGQWVAMKGKYPHEEVSQIPQHIHVENVIRLDVKGMTVERHLVTLIKI